MFNGDRDNVKIYDGINNENIRPLALNEDWTFAIDYKFFLNSSYINTGNEFVLASCYYNYNTVRFRRFSDGKETNPVRNTKSFPHSLPANPLLYARAKRVMRSPCFSSLSMIYCFCHKGH